MANKAPDAYFKTFKQRNILQAGVSTGIISSAFLPKKSKIPSPSGGGLGRGSPEVTPPQRLTSPHGGCFCPLDSGFRRNDERGSRPVEGKDGLTREKGIGWGFDGSVGLLSDGGHWAGSLLGLNLLLLIFPATRVGSA